MRVSKWGNSLAVRLPKEVVETLDLKVGEDIALQWLDSRTAEVTRNMTRAEAIEDLRRFEGLIPADFKFDRDEANAR